MQVSSGSLIGNSVDLTSECDALTAGDIIYGGAAGAVTALPKGTASQFLKMNSGATAPEWATSGNFSLVASGDATGIAANTFTSIGSLSGAKTYMLVLRIKNTHASNVGTMHIRLNGDSGTNYDYWTYTTTTLGYSTGQTSCAVKADVEDASVWSDVVIFIGARTTATQVPIDVIGGCSTLTGSNTKYLGGHWGGGAAITAISFTLTQTHEYEYELFEVGI